MKEDSIKNKAREKELEELKKQIQDELDEKYEHFEELNKYINDLLMTKKRNTINIEELKTRISEMDADFDIIFQN